MKNKVTEQDLLDSIKKETYFTTFKTTICVLTLKNTFEVVGESSCVDPTNFDKEIGERIAKENAVSKLWMLHGYALQERLNQAE